MLSVNTKSHVICHVLTLQIFGTPKKLCFWQNCEEVFNWLNFANSVELHKSYIRVSRDEVICRSEVTFRGYTSCLKWSAFTNIRSLTVRTLQESKCRCQLVVRLKANECYQKLLCYLSSYINLLNIRLFACVVGLCKSATDNVTTFKFVLIVLLTILLWLLWPYC